ncbi:hypothetical protein KDL44_04635 [bacterium]|nr:hypothetical protein [bacterium]
MKNLLRTAAALLIATTAITAPQAGEPAYGINDDCRILTVANDPSLAAPGPYQWIGWNMQDAAELNPARELSEAEQIRLGAWMDVNGFEHSLRSLSGLLGRYYRSTGALPADSQAVLAEFLVADNADGNSAASNLNLYNNLYDPITGALYSDFQSSAWKAGALFVEHFDNADEAQAKLEALLGEGAAGHSAETATHIVVYGEQPGSVIFDDWFF